MTQRSVRTYSWRSALMLTLCISLQGCSWWDALFPKRKEAPKPQIVLSSTTESFTVMQGAADPAARTVVITNSGGGLLGGLVASVTYSAEASDWLTATLNQLTAPAELTLQVSGTGLLPGTYSAEVNVAGAEASNTPQRVLATLTVTPPPPQIGLSVTSGTFSATAGGVASPSSRSVSITNTGGSSLTGLTTSVTYGIGQPTGWLGATLSGTTAPATLTLVATTGVLAAGTYNANVTVTSSVASNSPRTVAVTFTVSPASVTATRFQNESVWPVISLIVDGVERLTATGSVIASGGYLQLNLSPGAHTLRVSTGFWDGGTRFDLYNYPGTGTFPFTQVTGNVGTITIENITITQLMTRFGSSYLWEGEYFDQNVTLHISGLRFYSDGSCRLYRDGTQVTTCTYWLLQYVPYTVTFRVRYANGQLYDGTLAELQGYFYMWNGPSSWPQIQYTASIP